MSLPTARPSPRRSGPVSVLGLVALGALAAWGAAAGDRAAGPGVPWAYDGERGPAQWGALAPEYATCASGSRQSPIDIREVRPAAYAPLMFQYRSQPLRAINVGGQVRVLAAPGSELRLRGDAYALEELHFHVPGEHRFQGQSAAGEIHLVHRDALGRRAIVAVPLRAGRRVNSILMRIVERLPAGPGASVQFDRVGINPLFLIPTERDYVSYSGSLETPPCTEPVLWFVMTSALEVDPEQIRRIAQLVGANARPVQPQNGRPVYLARPGR